MTSLAILIPTVGRESLRACLESLADQMRRDDRVLVLCDEPTRYDYVTDLVYEIRSDVYGIWRSYYSEQQLGFYGHAQRNRALAYLPMVERPPDLVWSLDDDDVATPDALAAIRDAYTSHAAPWYVFRMVGGAHSHFNGLVVPATGGGIRIGEIGTPMIVAPLCAARFGVDAFPPGYFGDFSYACELEDLLGPPAWKPEIVAEIRPTAVIA